MVEKYVDGELFREQALVAVVQEAYVKGISTRKVDDLVQAMAVSGASLVNGRMCGWAPRI